MKTKKTCPHHRESLGLSDPPDEFVITKEEYRTRVGELEATIQRLTKENVKLKEILDKNDQLMNQLWWDKAYAENPNFMSEGP
jgi:hypothetical protein